MTNHEIHMKSALKEAREALNRDDFPVGSVIVCDGLIVSSGARYNSTQVVSEIDHAEIVALRNLQQHHPDIDLSQVTVYSTMEPCLMCYATMIVNGVRKIVYGYEDVMGGGTNLKLKQLSPLYNSIEMEITEKILRNECLTLFQQFFRLSNNQYLQNTLLAEYTVNQKITNP